MKQTYAYVSAVFAFSATTFAFAQNAIWPGILASLAGILALSSAMAEEKK